MEKQEIRILVRAKVVIPKGIRNKVHFGHLTLKISRKVLIRYQATE